MNNFNYSEIKKLFEQYQVKYSGDFSPMQKDLASELFNKLNDLDQVSTEITDLISKLFLKTDFSLDEDGAVTLGGLKVKLNPADPNVPIQLDNTTIAYSRGKSNVPYTDEAVEMERRLERAAVEFYHLADRISHITEKLPKLNSFKCNQIRIIRNHLIEHPEGKNSGITHDSFSYSINEGPYIKGLRINEQIEHRDEGFKRNSEEFISKLTLVIKKALL